VIAILRDLEAFARAEKAALAEIAEQASRPLRLPSNDEVMALATDLEGCLTDDPEVGRATLRRWLTNGVIRVDQSPDGPIAETELLPLMVLVDSAGKAARKSGGAGGRGAAGGRKLEIPGDGSFSKDLALLSMSSGGRI
jgi:hypothetical protein